MPTTADIERAKSILHEAHAVTVMTGAGISAESGIPTFRGAGGYWKGFSAIDLASPEGFARDPKKVWEWYNERRRNLRIVKPNTGHYALAELEQRVPRFGLITQNVDCLHRVAGSKRLVELHGNVWEVRCTGCETTFDRTNVDLPEEPKCEHCGDWLRPGVVWFGEMLPMAAVAKADDWTRRAEVFLVVGTSAVVYPAAGLTYQARENGAKVIEVNLEETPATEVADVSLQGKAGEILPLLLS